METENHKFYVQHICIYPHVHQDSHDAIVQDNGFQIVLTVFFKASGSTPYSQYAFHALVSIWKSLYKPVLAIFLTSWKEGVSLLHPVPEWFQMVHLEDDRTEHRVKPADSRLTSILSPP